MNVQSFKGPAAEYFRKKSFPEDVIKGHNKPFKYDIILCRYLFIYIDRELRNKILKFINSHLNEGGLLILGKTETLFNSYLNFKLIDSRNHIYIKDSKGI